MPLLSDVPFKHSKDVFFLWNHASLCSRSEAFVTIKSRQVPIRVCLGVRLDDSQFTPLNVSIPALLDTGFNGSLAITEQQLDKWCKLKDLRRLGKEIVSDKTLPLRGKPTRLFSTAIYLVPNQRGSWDPSDASPHRVSTIIHVVDDKEANQEEEPVFPLPILGMRCLDELGARLAIDHRRKLVHVARGRSLFWWLMWRSGL